MQLDLNYESVLLIVSRRKSWFEARTSLTSLNNMNGTGYGSWAGKGIQLECQIFMVVALFFSGTFYLWETVLAFLSWWPYPRSFSPTLRKI